MSLTPIDLKRRYHVAGHRQDATVRVMAVAEGWAMVRFRGAMPFVVRVSDLFLVKDYGGAE